MDYDQTVMTTKAITEGNSRVLHAVHSEGGWQFYGGEITNVADVRTASMKEVVFANSHVKDILWIPEGMEALFDPIRNSWLVRIADSE